MLKNYRIIQVSSFNQNPFFSTTSIINYQFREIERLDPPQRQGPQEQAQAPQAHLQAHGFPHTQAQRFMVTFEFFALSSPKTLM